MHFLVTNDDGYGAPGIVSLEKTLAVFGDVTVVAPSEHLSGCSHQVTSDKPLNIKQVASNHYSVNGYPADCVRVGLTHLKIEPDWIVSGINEGANLGCDLFYSGTVAAAREAVLFGRPGISVSHYFRRDNPIDWTLAAKRCQEVVEQLLTRPLPEQCYWNVNFPTSDRLEAASMFDCAPDPHPLAVGYDELNGSLHYRHGRYHDRPRSPGGDIDICFSGGIAISQVPLNQR